MLTKAYVMAKVKELLPVDSEAYDSEIGILVGGAMNKIKNEGIDYANITEGTDLALDYCVCCSYQVAMDLDLDIDEARLLRQYITRVNTLRTSLIV